MSYTHFTLSERKYLQELLEEGKNQAEISRILGRSRSSVSREIKRNASKYRPHKGSNNRYRYHAWRAQNLYTIRRRQNRRTAIKPGSDVWNYIVEHLNLYWSPEEIANRWAKDHPGQRKPCVSTIYRYIKLRLFPAIKAKTHLRRRGKRTQTRNANYNTIQPDRIIPEWPEVIRERLRIGDWEGDTVYGGVGKGLLVTLVDRKSRYLRMGLLSNRNAEETRRVIEKLLAGFPVNSVSLDNGSEFSEFHELERSLHTLVYFAEPHKPWQRGTNENTNDLVRFFYKKGFDFRTVTDEDVQLVENLINHRPRKCLNWKTPYEVFFENFVALA